MKPSETAFQSRRDGLCFLNDGQDSEIGRSWMFQMGKTQDTGERANKTA